FFLISLPSLSLSPPLSLIVSVSALYTLPLSLSLSALPPCTHTCTRGEQRAKLYTPVTPCVKSPFSTDALSSPAPLLSSPAPLLSSPLLCVSIMCWERHLLSSPLLSSSATLLSSPLLPLPLRILL